MFPGASAVIISVGRMITILESIDAINKDFSCKTHYLNLGA